MSGDFDSDVSPEESAKAGAARRRRFLLGLLLLIATLPPIYWFGEPGVRYVAWSATGSPWQEAALYRSVVPLGSLARGWLTGRVRARLARPPLEDVKDPANLAHNSADVALYDAVKSLSVEDLEVLCEELLRSGDENQASYACRVLSEDLSMQRSFRGRLRAVARELGMRPIGYGTSLTCPDGVERTFAVPLLSELVSVGRDERLRVLGLLWLGSEQPKIRTAGAVFLAEHALGRAWVEGLRSWLKSVAGQMPDSAEIADPKAVMQAIRKLTNAKWVKSRKLPIDPAPITARALSLIRELLPEAQGETKALLESALKPLSDAEVKPVKPREPG